MRVGRDMHSEMEAVMADMTADKRNFCTIPIIDKDGYLIPAKDLIPTQKNPAIILSSLSSLEEALKICLDTAIHVSPMDSGGICHKDASSVDFNLARIWGVSDQFVRFTSCMVGDSPVATLIKRRIPIYTNRETFNPINLQPGMEIGGLKLLAIIPVLDSNQVPVLWNVASHSVEHGKCVPLLRLTRLCGDLQRLRASNR